MARDMVSPYVRGWTPSRQVVRVALGGLLLNIMSGCFSPAYQSTRSLRLMLDAPPISVNPRSTFDAAGQWLNALVFRALTRIDENLEPRPDLAASWAVSRDGLHWSFKLPAGAVDQEGGDIDAPTMAACLENYRDGHPASPYRGSFTSWVSTTVSGRDVVVMNLSKPDPYLARNVSLLRFFRSPGAKTPCEEPAPGSRLIGSGSYRPTSWAVPENDVTLIPIDPSAVPIHVEYVKDSTVMILKLLRGEVDATLNSLTLSKTRLVKEKYQDRFDVLERDGVRVAYLAFNLRDPLLSHREVRQAIALAIHRDEVIRNNLFGFGSPAGSFLAPMLKEAWQARYPYDPAEAERILDRAGYPRKADGTRFEVHYKTTPRREGIEQAQIFQDMLARVGIRLVIDVVEPAVFFASVKAGNFQLHSSRWLGVADGSILYQTLHSKGRSNRAFYQDEKMDHLLEQASSEQNEPRRIELLKQVQRKMAEDVPYLPLWNWNNALILRKGVHGLTAEKLSLSGALEPLTALRPF